jgi:hypothetical protein
MKIAGRLTKRPSSAHPNPSHWMNLREQALAKANHECRCCPASSDKGYRLELHHRHYDTFGNENLDDVIVLCRQCHEAITSRLRAERPAKQIEFVGGNIARPGRIETAQHKLTPLIGMEYENVNRISFLSGDHQRAMSNSYAQRPISRPVQSVYESLKIGDK